MSDCKNPPKHSIVAGRYWFLAGLLALGLTVVSHSSPAMASESRFGAWQLEVWFDDNVTMRLEPGHAPVIADQDKRALETDWLAAVHSRGGRWRKLTSQPDSILQRLRQNAEHRLHRSIPDFTRIYVLTFPDRIAGLEWKQYLSALSFVRFVEERPQPLPPPSAPDFFPDQGYLQDSPDGIAAETMWSIPGGTGGATGVDAVKICDVEFAWNLDHADLPPVTVLVPAGMTVWSPLADDNHGTAVLGQLGSKRDSIGTTGAAYEAEFYVAPSGLDSAWQPGAAILQALTVLGEGDVLLIEHEMTGPTGAAVPIEWWPSWYAAIVTAVGNGVHVVEAAGNGGVNLDDPIFSVGNGGHWPFRPENHSGAILVGAGAAPLEYGGSDTARSRLSFSNYGSRVDLQGWGERVATTGYGYAYPLEGKNHWYTRTFTGTSSAAPNVAGAVAALEGAYREASGGDHLDPSQLRSILIATGTPQQAGAHPVIEHIGPLPNLPAAYTALPITCCVGSTGNVDCDPDEIVSLTDLTRLVNHLFVTFTPLCCPTEGNVDGDPAGLINLSDVTRLSTYLFVTFDPLPDCGSH